MCGVKQTSNHWRGSSGTSGVDVKEHAQGQREKRVKAIESFYSVSHRCGLGN